MALGRPRTVSFSDEEFEILGEEMVKWVTENYDYALHLSDWYTVVKGFTYNQWKTFLQKEAFLPHYEKALKIVGRKYLDKNTNIRDGISQRWQRVYFKDLREEEDDTADQEVIRKKAIEASDTSNEAILNGMNAVLTQLRTLQSESALNMAVNNISNEQKS